MTMTEQMLECDEKGRVVMPKKMRESFGTKFFAVEVNGKVVFYPVPKDPIGALAKMGKKAGLDKIPLKMMKEEIRKHALECV